MSKPFDVVIIGGGINGCGCAADAALRGLSVLLCEEDDLASKTSSSSSKLIHGGLRYLEYFDFSMVKKSLKERELLMKLAPHLVHPLPIVLPYTKNMRSSLVLRAGLWLYDNLERTNTLPHSKLIKRKKDPKYFDPVLQNFQKGFLFYDAITDDARLTLVNALQARNHGANIMTHTKLIKATAQASHWNLTLQTKSAKIIEVQACSVINAAGPWVESVNKILQLPSHHAISHIKGSHLLVHKFYDGNHAYLLQHHDKRVVFVIPYHGYTIIGTTELNFKGSLTNIHIEPCEVNYLLSLVNSYFSVSLKEHDIISSWSGVRPLLADTHKDPSALTREYLCEFSNNPAPAITIYGGKITTYRQLSQDVIDKLQPIFPGMPNSKTSITPLPGAAFGNLTFAQYKQYARNKYYWLTENVLQHYLNTYGTLLEKILVKRNNMTDLGPQFSLELYQCEIDYLLKNEWATSCEDILWRRTKLKLHMTKTEELTMDLIFE